jgi:hypothetical protein
MSSIVITYTKHALHDPDARWKLKTPHSHLQYFTWTPIDGNWKLETPFSPHQFHVPELKSTVIGIYRCFSGNWNVETGTCTSKLPRSDEAHM